MGTAALAERRHDRVSLHDKYDRDADRALLSGVEALVRLVLEQRWLDLGRGLRTGAFVSGYEGSPLGGLDLELRRAHDELTAAGAVFEPGLNEELAATAVAGSQLVGTLPGRRVDGVAGFWFGKNPGFDRAADAIRHGNVSGTAPLGGAVAVVGDDPACKSSTLPSACEELARSLGTPVLAPSSVAQVLELGLHAIALSRCAGVWATLKVVADVADGSAVVNFPAGWADVATADAGRAFAPAALVGPGAVAAEEHLRTVRLPSAIAYARESGLNVVRYEASRPRTALVASGHCYATLVRALDDLGIGPAERQQLGLRVVELRMPWPLDDAHLRRLLDGVAQVVVVEDKTPFVEGQITAALYGTRHAPQVVGRLDPTGRPLLPAWGTLDADTVARALARVLPSELLPAAALRRVEVLARETTAAARMGTAPMPAAARTPYFCSGCPHNRSTRAPDGSLVGLGIGCHIMASFDADHRGHQVGTTQMGGEGAQWIGMAPFTDTAHFTQNLGDGTYFHSGSLAVRAAVAAGVSVTYKLLFNDAVAMTGGQAPVGRLDVPRLAGLLLTEGVRRVVVVTPDLATYRRVRLPAGAMVVHRDRLDAVERELAGHDGVSVIVYDDRCAAEERRLRSRGQLPRPERRVFVNERVCEGCGDCAAKSSCLSVVPVETEYGTKTRIDQGSCNQDYSCLEGDCPSFVEVRPRRRRRAPTPEPNRSVPPPPVSSPTHHRMLDHVAVRMVGVGGTGVITASRIVEMAAHLAGLHAAAVDQTGLSQKGGPVVSDLRIARQPLEGTPRISARSADVVLGFDLLEAASSAALASADPSRTEAVLTSHVTPTASMVQGTRTADGPALVQRVAARTRTGGFVVVDADAIARHLVGEPMAANLVVVGAACQHGSLPLPVESLEEAVRLNAAAVEQNLAALAWGRAAVADPQLVAQALAPRTPVAMGATRRPVRPPMPMVDELLGDLALSAPATGTVTRLARDLADYQSERYARRFVTALRPVAEAERRRTGDPQWPVTEACARGLHKLMAYKDEYEVARLHRMAAERQRLRDELGHDVRTRVLLHPPVLRSLGLRRKIGLGRSARPLFAVLRAARRLRGTPADPFGHTEMRRTERALVAEYLALVHEGVEHLSPHTVDTVVRLAGLPAVVRGYEDVKKRNVERFRTDARSLLEELARADRRPELPLAS